jgi:hypothetical protein
MWIGPCRWRLGNVHAYTKMPKADFQPNPEPKHVIQHVVPMRTGRSLQLQNAKTVPALAEYSLFPMHVCIMILKPSIGSGNCNRPAKAASHCQYVKATS